MARTRPGQGAGMRQRHVNTQANFPVPADVPYHANNVERQAVEAIQKRCNTAPDRAVSKPSHRGGGHCCDDDACQNPNAKLPPVCTEMTGGPFGAVYRGFLNRCGTPPDVKMARGSGLSSTPYALHFGQNSKNEPLLDPNSEVSTMALGPLSHWWRHRSIGTAQVVHEPSPPKQPRQHPVRPVNGRLPPMEAVGATNCQMSHREKELEQKLADLENVLTASFERINDAENCIVAQHKIIEMLNNRIENYQCVVDEARQNGFLPKWSDQTSAEESPKPLAETQKVGDNKTQAAADSKSKKQKKGGSDDGKKRSEEAKPEAKIYYE